MEREPIILGKNLKKLEKREVKFFIHSRKKEALKPLEKEIKKTKEEIEFIKKVDLYLAQELSALGLKKDFSLLPSQFHFLPDEVFSKKFPEEAKNSIEALSDPTTNSVYINKSKRTRLHLCKSILHEAIHLVSLRVHYADAKRKKIRIYRSGYQVFNPKEKKHEHFRGLNEAIVDKTAIEILKKHKKEIIEELNIAPKEQREKIPIYEAYIQILDTVIQRIAKKNNESTDIVWQRFKKGLFTGKMLHLKDVEKTFGKGALRVLAALGSDTKDLPEKEINQKIFQYFTTDNKKEKDKIAAEILSERERIRYKQRQK